VQIGRALGVAVLAGVRKVKTAPAHWVARDRQTARRRNGSRDPTIARALGVVLAITGGVLAITGGVLLALVATDGRLSSGSRLLPTPTSALVSPITSIQNAIGITQGMGGHTNPTDLICPSPGQRRCETHRGWGNARRHVLHETFMRIARLCTRSEGQLCNREWCDVTSGERSGV
jgi:hypothetical protein